MAIGTRHGIFAIALVRSAPSWPQISGYDVAKAATLLALERVLHLYGEHLPLYSREHYAANIGTVHVSTRSNRSSKISTSR